MRARNHVRGNCIIKGAQSLASHEEGSNAIILSLKSDYHPEVVEMYSLDSMNDLPDELENLEDWEKEAAAAKTMINDEQ